MDRFLMRMAKADIVDVMTYSIGRFPRLKYRRVLMCTGKFQSPSIERPLLPKGRAEVRALDGIHSKVWLAWTGRIMEAYVGSFNLTAPTNENVMVRVDNNKKEWLLYFDHFWAQGRILS